MLLKIKYIPILLQNARVVSRIKDENQMMVTEKSAEIYVYISSFLQGSIIEFLRLTDDSKSHFEVEWVYIKIVLR